MPRRVKVYTAEFKAEAIKLAQDSVSVSAAARDLEIPDATLHSWVSKAHQTGKCSVISSTGDINHVNVSELVNENKTLKKRLARLEQEKAILKKAATYFAKELE